MTPLDTPPTPAPPVKAAPRQWGANAVIFLALSFGLYFGGPVLIPAMVALLLSCLLWPVVGFLRRLGIPWALSATAVVLVVVAALAVAGYAFMLTVPRLARAFPSDPAKVQEVYSRLRDRVDRLSPWALDEQFLPERADDSQAIKYIRTSLDPKNPQFIVNTLLGVGAVGGYLLQATLILFLLLFFLIEGRLTSRLIDALSSAGDMRASAVTALQEMGAQVRSYLVWRTAVNLLMGAVFGLVYYFSGLTHPWTWAVLAALLLYVPYLGAVLAGLPPILDAFLSVESPWAALGVLLFYLAAVTAEGYFIVPYVMGRSLDLNASSVLLTTLYWDLVWGPAGLFLAMPIMAMAKTVSAHVPGWRPWGRIMDADSVEPADPGRLQVYGAGPAEGLTPPRRA